MKFQSLEATESLTRVALIGMLDSAGVEEVEREFMAATAERGVSTIIDVSQLTFMASLGMQLLLRCVKELQRRGASLVLLKPPGDVERALTVTKLTNLLPIARDEIAARRILGLS